MTLADILSPNEAKVQLPASAARLKSLGESQSQVVQMLQDKNLLTEVVADEMFKKFHEDPRPIIIPSLLEKTIENLEKIYKPASIDLAFFEKLLTSKAYFQISNT